MKYEDYEQQKMLYERFIQNSNLKDFEKMKKLTESNNYNYSSSKTDKRKFNANKLFHSFKYKNPSYDIYRRIKSNNDDNDNDDVFNLNDNNNRGSFTPSEINNYKIDFRNIIYDPQYKDKCLKGNYKWGNMKFNQLKLNMAKRKGVSFEDFKMPKIDKNLNKMNRMEINGRLIIGNDINSNNINKIYNNIMVNDTENNLEYKKKMINNIMNKNSDYIKKKYSGKINQENNNNISNNQNNYYSNNVNDNRKYDLNI